jgi:hypothetical protein
MNTDIPRGRDFVTETPIESTFIPLDNAGLLLERNSSVTHFAIPPSAGAIKTRHSVAADRMV